MNENIFTNTAQMPRQKGRNEYQSNQQFFENTDYFKPDQNQQIYEEFKDQ